MTSSSEYCSNFSEYFSIKSFPSGKVIVNLAPADIDSIYYEVGKKLIEKNDPLIKDFIENKIRINKNILNKLEGKEGAAIEERKSIVSKKIEDLNRLLIK